MDGESASPHRDVRLKCNWRRRRQDAETNIFGAYGVQICRGGRVVTAFKAIYGHDEWPSWPGARRGGQAGVALWLSLAPCAQPR